ncbi:MAG: hypothetical protein FWB80_12095 [Defluviitaleaceae bacterium]|nr:hypothetical protein [Defluviitaleaceae bacterium]
MDSKKPISEGYSEMGEFWLADSPDSKIICMLSVGARDKVSLRFYNDFPGYDTIRMMFDKRGGEFEAIHGRTRSGLMVGLFKCIHLGSAIHANYMLIGKDLPRYNKLEDYKFNHISAMYHDVREWLRGTLKLDNKDHDNGNMNIKMREVPSFKFNDCEIKLNYHWNFSHKESELTSENIFLFKFDIDTEIGTIMKYTDIFGDFLLLCVNAPVVTKFLNVGTHDSKDKIQVLFQKRESSKQRDPKFSEVISYWTLSNDFQNILHGWFQLGLDRETRDAIALYVESQTSNSVTEISFLILYQACEGIAKRVEPTKYKKKHAKGLIFEFLCCAAAPLIDFLDYVAIAELSHKMNETRKYWIHNSGNVAKGDTYGGFNLVAINKLLSYSLRVYLLSKVGVSQDIIKQCLSPYQGIGFYMLEELKSMDSNCGDTQVDDCYESMKTP